jgi:hypothetical protein
VAAVESPAMNNFTGSPGVGAAAQPASSIVSKAMRVFAPGLVIASSAAGKLPASFHWRA